MITGLAYNTIISSRPANRTSAITPLKDLKMLFSSISLSVKDDQHFVQMFIKCRISCVVDKSSLGSFIAE